MSDDLAAKLTQDLRWRLSQPGRKYRPSAKELQSWGAFNIPWIASALFSIVVFAAGLAGLMEAIPQPGDALAILLTFALMGLCPFAVFKASGWVNSASAAKSYRRLLQGNERFALVEYSKYLKRQIERAKSEPVLGGEPEVARLTELLGRLNTLLARGAGKGAPPIASDLSEDAALAEGVITSYEEQMRDPLSELDSRLPPELKQRVEELDRESNATARQAGTIPQ